MSNRSSILVFDDQPRAVEAIARILDEEFDVHTAVNADDARNILRQEWVQTVLCYLRKLDVTGVSCARMDWEPRA